MKHVSDPTPGLFEMRDLAFDGQTFEPLFDAERLGEQLGAVYRVVRDGEWRTAGELERATGYGWASVSARLRDLRKAKFGGFTIERRRRGEEERGVFEYRMSGRDSR